MSRYAFYRGNTPYSTHALLAGSVGRNETVLDVGCNEGYIGAHCDPSNTFYGIDFDEQAAAVARKSYADGHTMDLNQTTALPWNIQFDRIIFGDVLEHLLDPQAVFRSLVYGYMKPLGLAVVSLPNIANWRIRLNLLRGMFDYQDSGILDRTHLHFYTFASARKMLENECMRVCWITGGGSTFGAAIQRAPVTRGLLAQSIVMQLQYVPEVGVSCS